MNEWVSEVLFLLKIVYNMPDEMGRGRASDIILPSILYSDIISDCLLYNNKHTR